MDEPQNKNEAADGRSALTAVLEPMAETTLCWNCNTVYAMSAEQCPGCGATNANKDFDVAQREMAMKTANAPHKPRSEAESA